MFCDRCGKNIEEGQNFCPGCGKTLQPQTVVPGERRVVSRVRLLAILWLAYSALHLIPGLVLMSLFRNCSDGLFPPGAPAFVPGLLHGIGFALSAISLVGLIAGWGLLSWKSWARTLSIVLGALSLLNLPFGTALGIYTLWVLLPESSEREYQQRAMAAVTGVPY